MMGDISVVIPVHNGAVHLAETIESVLAQTLPAASIIVVDDGSNDDTPNVAQAFGERIRYVRQDHAGAAQARNTGVQQVGTNYLAFLDGDDLWVPSKLELQRRVLARSAEPLMVFGHTIQFASPELSREETAALKFPTTPMAAITASALLMRTTDFLAAGNFDTALETGEFIEWYARARDKGTAAHVLPEIVVHRRLHRNNHGRRRRDARPDYVRALKSVLDSRRKSG
jgi:glycosyltransferase involved in cell wall biosynthesis